MRQTSDLRNDRGDYLGSAGGVMITDDKTPEPQEIVSQKQTDQIARIEKLLAQRKLEREEAKAAAQRNSVQESLRKAGYVEPVLPPSTPCDIDLFPEDKQKFNPWLAVMAVYVLLAFLSLCVLSIFAIPVLLAIKLLKSVL